ncbi:MAG: beta-xylosidase, partial [Rariglobus sp.]
AGPDAAVTLDLTGLPAAARNIRLRHYRIDRDHGNAFTAWQNQGSPQAPTPAQFAELEHASRLTELTPATLVHPESAKLTLPLTLPRQAISLLVLEWD